MMKPIPKNLGFSQYDCFDFAMRKPSPRVFDSNMMKPSQIASKQVGTTSLSGEGSEIPSLLYSV